MSGRVWSNEPTIASALCHAAVTSIMILIVYIIIAESMLLFMAFDAAVDVTVIDVDCAASKSATFTTSSDLVLTLRTLQLLSSSVILRSRRTDEIL